MVPIVLETSSYRRDIYQKVGFDNDERRGDSSAIDGTVEQVQLHTFRKQVASSFYVERVNIVNAYGTFRGGCIDIAGIPTGDHTAQNVTFGLVEMNSASARIS